MRDEQDAPAAFDEEEATRRAKKMKVEELRAVLEAAGEDTEGTKPALVERAVAAARAASQAWTQAMEEDEESGEEGYDSEEGYSIDAGDEIEVGACLLAKLGGDGLYDCVVEAVTETGYKVLFTSGDRGELPREHLRYYAGDEAGYFVLQGAAIAVGAELLGKRGDECCDCVVEEVTEAGCRSSRRGSCCRSGTSSTSAPPCRRC